VIGHRTVGVGSDPKPAVSNELVDKFRVVLRHIVTAKLRVFIGDGVKAVRTRRDDNLGLQGIQSRDVFRRHLGKEILVACAPRQVAGALFLSAQHSPV
jgi:hypothetical protein